MRCDTCIHWGDPNEFYPPINIFKRCMAIKEIENIEETAVKNEPWPGGPHLEFHYNAETDREETDDPAWNRYQALKDQAVDAERVFITSAHTPTTAIYTKDDFFCAKYEPGKISIISIGDQ